MQGRVDFLSWAGPSSLAGRYGLAIALAVATIALRHGLERYLSEVQFFAFFPAIIVAAFYCGRGPGLAAAGICGAGGWFMFLEPSYSFALHRAEDGYALAAFAIVAALVVVAAGESRRAIEKQANLGRSLALANERVQIAQRAARAVVWEQDVASGLTHWGDRTALADLTGTDLGDASRLRDWMKLVHPDDKRPYFDQWTRALAAGEGRVVFRILRDGQTRWIEVFGRVIDRCPAGKPLRMAGISMDATERFAAISELEAREAQLQTIVETVPIGLVMAELPSGRIVGGNRYVERMLRHPVLHSPDIDSYDEWVSFHADGTRVSGHEYPLARMVLAGEDNPSIEVNYQRGDGTRAWTLITGRPVKDAEGNVTGGVVALVDIDEKRKAKQALEEALQAKETLLYEVNHRVKNSLQMVGSLLLIEGAKVKDPAARAAIMDVRQKLSAIASLHQRLYNEGEHDRVRFGPFLEDLIGSLVSSAGKRDVAATVHCDGPSILPMRQAGPLSMIATELVTNALKHAFDGSGTIAVRFEAGPERVMLEVEDDGRGVPPGFDPTLATSTGMKIHQGLVRQIGGQLETANTGRGTLFRVTA